MQSLHRIIPDVTMLFELFSAFNSIKWSHIEGHFDLPTKPNDAQAELVYTTEPSGYKVIPKVFGAGQSGASMIIAISRITIRTGKDRPIDTRSIFLKLAQYFERMPDWSGSLRIRCDDGVGAANAYFTWSHTAGTVDFDYSPSVGIEQNLASMLENLPKQDTSQVLNEQFARAFNGTTVRVKRLRIRVHLPLFWKKRKRGIWP